MSFNLGLFDFRDTFEHFFNMNANSSSVKKFFREFKGRQQRYSNCWGWLHHAINNAEDLLEHSDDDTELILTARDL